MENKHYIIIGILILGLICGVTYYYMTQETEDLNTIKKLSNSNKNGIVLGDSDDQTQTNINTESNTSSDTIASGEIYYAKITAIRKPINDSFDDLNAKMKYKTLFSEEEAQKAIDDLINLINESLENIKNLKIDPKFSQANEKEIESLTYLSEAMDAFKQLNASTDQEERTKLNDIYSYKIDQSNKILEDIAIPK